MMRKTLRNFPEMLRFPLNHGYGLLLRDAGVLRGGCVCRYKWKIPFVYQVDGERESRTQWMDMTSGLC